ncbi:MAG: ABC transporter permease [Acidobacteria bacterium]|nr:ABC transporter permease [Acidobacteriota bacterium]
MLRSLLKLTWVEIKIFVREPMGVLGTVGIPVLIFLALGKTLGGAPEDASELPTFLGPQLPVFAAVFIAVGSVLSLVAIISIYREGGILKRLRATPLRPQIILSAHVLVKLLFTTVTIALLLLAGRRFFPVAPEASLFSLGLALLFTTVSILAIGFVIASVVPTARFAQPIGSAILYPMLALSGVLVSAEGLPAGWRVVANLLPLTHAVSLLQGIWTGAGWGDHLIEVAALILNFVICIALSAKIFRWE